MSVKASGSEVEGVGEGWETDVAFSHQEFDGEGKEERHSWSGVSGSVSGGFGVSIAAKREH